MATQLFPWYRQVLLQLCTFVWNMFLKIYHNILFSVKNSFQALEEKYSCPNSVNIYKWILWKAKSSTYHSLPKMANIFCFCLSQCIYILCIYFSMSYRFTFRWVIGAPGSVDDIVLSQCRGQGVECYWHQEEVRPDPTATEIPTVWPVMLCVRGIRRREPVTLTPKIPKWNMEIFICVCHITLQSCLHLRVRMDIPHFPENKYIYVCVMDRWKYTFNEIWYLIINKKCLWV